VGDLDGRACSAKFGQHPLLVEAEEAFLVWADLMDVDVVVAGIGIAAAVAAAWATIAGCRRMSGQVTPVPRRRRVVACTMAPSAHQTNGLCPCRSIQGW